MDRLLRLSMLTKCFFEKSQRTPSELMRILECKRHSLYRLINFAITEYNMPLSYNRKKRVYFYDKEVGEKTGFPLIWFTPQDALMLISLLENFKELPFYFEDNKIYPFKTKLKNIAKVDNKRLKIFLESVKILPTHFRKTSKENLFLICDGIARRKKMKIVYKDRQNDRKTERIISPLQLVKYRDNWYLDAFCHKRNEIRIFSLDRILKGEILKEKAKSIPKKQLKEFFEKSYGIFAGKPKEEAVLQFSKEISRWVSAEEWHPEQESIFQEDGSYILKMPYSDERELILDIMKYGENVKVLKPDSLKLKIIEKHKKAYSQYQN